MNNLKTFRIRDIPGMTGLHVVGRKLTNVMLHVEQIINTNTVVGDRQLKYPIPADSVLISLDYLDEVRDVENLEFANDNPFGKYLYEGSFEKESLRIIHAVYENAITVSVVEGARSLFSGNFFKNREEIIKSIESMLHGKLDPEDLLFKLHSVKQGR